MLVYSPGKYEHGWQKLRGVKRFSGSESIGGSWGSQRHLPEGWGRPWGSKLSHDPVTGEQNGVNTGKGKQLEQGYGRFAASCSNLTDTVQALGSYFEAADELFQ